MQTTSKASASKKSKQLKREPLLEKSNLIEKQQYDDIYVRDNFGDNGVYPTTGSLDHSPDIIPQGENPVADPYKYFITDNEYKDLGQSIYSNQANYIYMRAQNLSTSPRDGKLYLYWTRASMIWCAQDPIDPDRGWKHQHIPTASGAEYCTIKAKNGGSEVVTTDPFCWLGDPLGADDHYYLIGRVETEENPNPIPDFFNSLSDFAEYIAQHPNMCWRNIGSIYPNSGTYTATVHYEQGEKTEDMGIIIRCSNAPVGSEVSFSCGTCGPIPLIKLEKTMVTSEDYFSAGGFFTIPANFSSNISYTYYSNGLKPGKNLKIELIVLYPVSPRHKQYKFATPLADLGVPLFLIEEIHRKRKVNSAISRVKGIVVSSHEIKTSG